MIGKQYFLQKIAHLAHLILGSISEDSVIAAETLRLGALWLRGEAH